MKKRGKKRGLQISLFIATPSLKAHDNKRTHHTKLRMTGHHHDHHQEEEDEPSTPRPEAPTHPPNIKEQHRNSKKRMARTINLHNFIFMPPI